MTPRQEDPRDVPAARSTVHETSFAHASEAELARILDFYAVRWEYEPHLFPILWNLDGDVVESFAPDFFLPDLDLYLEMTTLKQSLVRRKNRKLRRLRELYPDLHVKLFYARDFRALMLKYGKIGLVDELSGSSGHLMPARLEEPAAPLLASSPAAAVAVPEPPEPLIAAMASAAASGATSSRSEPSRVHQPRRARRSRAARRRRASQLRRAAALLPDGGSSEGPVA